jgi:hypothetical protein
MKTKLQTVRDALEECGAFSGAAVQRRSEAIAIIDELLAKEPVVFAKSISDELMDCVDRLGSEYDQVDPQVWRHLLVYAPKVDAEPEAFLVEGLSNGELISHQLYFTLDDAKRTAAVFATHYPTVNTKALVAVPVASTNSSRKLAASKAANALALGVLEIATTPMGLDRQEVLAAITQLKEVLK